MPGYRILKRKKNEIEYFTTEEAKKRYYKRIITLEIIVVLVGLLAIILL